MKAGRLLFLAALTACVGPEAGDTGQDITRADWAGYEDLPRFGGSGSVSDQLAEDNARKAPLFPLEGLQRRLEPYEGFKARLYRDHGFAFGVDYTALRVWADESPGKDEANGGIFRVYGSWTALGRGTPNTGSLVYKAEHRNRLGSDVAPEALASETGYAGSIGEPFDSTQWNLTGLYWQSELQGGRVGLVGGWVDARDYVDACVLNDPSTHFLNDAFSTGAGTIPVPDQGLGAAFSAMLTDQVYLSAGLADAASDPHDPDDSFFDEEDYFTHVELGWTSAPERRYLDTTHLTFWHVDERDEASDGWGTTFSFARFVDDRWMPFMRIGYADDGGGLLEKSVSAGAGYYLDYGGDLIGLGLNWAEPSDDVYGSGVDDQCGAEFFYRIQVSESFTLTPDVQFLLDPALNSDEDSLWVLGLRARLAL